MKTLHFSSEIKFVKLDVKDYYLCGDKKKIVNGSFITIYKKKDWAKFGNYSEWLSFLIKVSVNSED